jgi:nitroreductase
MMDSLELLLTRQSNAYLTEPSPNNHDIDLILKAGMRVPDHGGLMPWQFLIVAEQGLQKLSDIFAATVDENDEKKLIKIKKKPFRAPMIIVVSTVYKSHEKVPKQEQLITAGCCTQAMQMAAFSLGYGAVWRTGSFAYHQEVKKGLSIESHEDIVGFLYLGTPSKDVKLKETKFHQDKVTYL